MVFYNLSSKTAKNSYISIVDQGIVSLTNFLTALLLARFCSQSEYGHYVLALSIILFWDNLRRALISSPFVVYLPRKPPAESKGYVGGTFLFHVAFSIIGGVLFAAGSVILYSTGDAALGAVILAAIYAVFGFTSREYMRRIFYARLKIHSALIIDVLNVFLQVSGIVVLTVTGRLFTVNALLLIGTAQTISSALGLLLIRKHISFRGLDIKSMLRSHWRLGKWLAATGIVFALAFQIYPWFLKYTWGECATARFGACIPLLTIINPFFLGISNFIGPKMSTVFANEGIAGLRRVLRKGVFVLGTGIGLYVIIITIFSEPLLVLMYGGKYTGLTAVIALLGVNTLLNGIASSYGAALSIMERTDFSFYANLASIAVTFSIGIFLVINYGVLGAAIAYAAAKTVSTILFILFYRRTAARFQKTG
jgi:O-antigen/teichoic acid export membrane protein